MMIVKFSKVSKVYRKRAVVNNVNLEIGEKGCIGLVGPNGSGKTTLLNLIAGNIFPTAGTIEKSISNLETGISFGSTHGFYPGFGFDKNITLIYAIKGQKPDKEALQRLREIFRIDASFNKPFKLYSTGMKQKLSLISALICKPKFLILDEPANGLDIDAVQELRKIINDLKSTIPVLVTGHILGELEKVCDIIFFIKNGKLSEQFENQEILSKFGSLENAYNQLKHVV